MKDQEDGQPCAAVKVKRERAENLPHWGTVIILYERLWERS